MHVLLACCGRSNGSGWHAEFAVPRAGRYCVHIGVEGRVGGQIRYPRPLSSPRLPADATLFSPREPFPIPGLSVAPTRWSHLLACIAEMMPFVPTRARVPGCHLVDDNERGNLMLGRSLRACMQECKHAVDGHAKQTSIHGPQTQDACLTCANHLCSSQSNPLVFSKMWW